MLVNAIVTVSIFSPVFGLRRPGGGKRERQVQRPRLIRGRSIDAEFHAELRSDLAGTSVEAATKRQSLTVPTVRVGDCWPACAGSLTVCPV
jgi:hypothetical protein